MKFREATGHEAIGETDEDRQKRIRGRREGKQKNDWRQAVAGRKKSPGATRKSNDT